MVTKTQQSRHDRRPAASSEHVSPAGELQGVHDALDPLRVLAGGDQQGVGGVDDHDVLHADER